MADDDKLTAQEADNFGAQPETDAGAAGATGGYIANFNGDEIDGRRYELGERIAADVDAGTIAYLVQNGRISAVADGVDAAPSGGEGGAGIPGPTLTGEQQAEADQLVKDNTAAELRQIAEDEGVTVESDDTKPEVAAKIVAARNA